MNKTTAIDSDNVAQLVLEGIEIIRDHNNNLLETPAERHTAAVKLAAAGIPFARLESQRDTARAILDGDTATLDDAKLLRVGVAHEALDAILYHYWPDTI